MKPQHAAVIVPGRRFARDGCEYSVSCLDCPLPICKYEMGTNRPLWSRGFEVALRLRAGESERQIVKAMGFPTREDAVAAYLAFLRPKKRAVLANVSFDRTAQSTPRVGHAQASPDAVALPPGRVAPCRRPHCGGTLLPAGKTQHCALCGRSPRVMRRQSPQRKRARRTDRTGSSQERSSSAPRTQ